SIADMLIAELAEISFDSFMETDDGFQASVESDSFNKEAAEEIFGRYKASHPGLQYEMQEVARVNWNEEWEKNYDPIIVSDKCIVRASFHKPDRDYQYDIIINPKMSFGTGHHETTFLMLSAQMQVDHSQKRVLDIGC